ncbi:uncharacterized protein V2V93DRAFT_365565 [Kockiozyma suomiensis]|uniref:uncharacterized protein n=1 Tax=Kockiozyma suomiensis TaxID=1337062 RepID=UPI00334321A2
MVFVKDSRLQNVIADHPIFSGVGNGSERINIGSVSSFLSSPQLPAQILSSEPAVKPSDDNEIRNVVAVRGAEIFFAIDGQVRCVDCANIRESKNSRSYKILNIPRIEFAVRQLKINETGTLLAIIGDCDIVICILPLPGFSKQVEPKLHARRRTVGERVFSSNIKIRKALWHPLSKEDSCLLVLCSDNTLRMFDLNYSYDEPEQVYNFSKSKSASESTNSFGLSDDDEMEMVSMCFGSPVQGMGSMALYVLSSEGDICALSPFIPRQCAIQRENITMMLQWAIAEDRDNDIEVSASPSSTSSANDASARVERFRRRQQVTWVADVVRQCNSTRPVGLIPRINRYGESADLCVFERPDTIKYAVKLQNPVRPVPFPADLYGAIASDITILELENDSTILITVDQKGRVNLFLQDTPIGALWETSIFATLFGDEEEVFDVIDEPTVQTIESIQLKSNTLSTFGKANAVEEGVRYNFVEVSLDNDYVLLMSSTRIIQIDFKNWKQKLSDAFASARPESDLRQVLLEKDGKPKSEIKSLYTTAASSKGVPLGAIVVPNAILGDILIVPREGGIEVFIDDEEGGINPLGAQVSNYSLSQPLSANASRVTYQTLMSPVPIDVSSLTRGSSTEAKLALKRGMVKFSLTERPLEVSEDSLEYLGNAAELLEVEIRDVQNVGLKLQRRLVEQRGELERQIRKLQEVLSRAADSTQEVTATDQVGKIFERQKSLNDRADRIYKKLVETQPLPISDSERKWIQELHRVKAKVDERTTGLKPRATMATSQAKKIVAMAGSVSDKSLTDATNKSPKPLMTGLRREKIESLKELIDTESSIINKTRSAVDSLMQRIDERMESLSLASAE